MYDIILGRSQSDLKKFGTKGTILLGKHYVKMGQVTSLSNSVFMDVTKSHVVFVCGKRGSGKSFTLGVMAEGVAELPLEIKKNLTMLLFDTMGIFWTMKYPNYQERDLLEKWEIKPKGLDVTLFTPKGFFDQFKERGIPVDYPFSLKPSELDIDDWCLTFGIGSHSEESVILERVITKLRPNYSIKDIIKGIQDEPKAEDRTKNLLTNLFSNAEAWGLFDEAATNIKDLVGPGQITILDLSVFAHLPNGWEIKGLVLAIISKKLFSDRMIARRQEEYAQVHDTVHYFGEEDIKTLDSPLVWLVIDEAHELLPRNQATVATSSLVTILREGRQPGISLILASQQPGKIHTDVMTQSDIVISHRITAKMDTEALGLLMQSYMRKSVDKYLDDLPREKGAAIVLDDENERMYPIRVRPRFTWHGGSAPEAIPPEKQIFDF